MKLRCDELYVKEIEFSVVSRWFHKCFPVKGFGKNLRFEEIGQL